MTELVSVPYVYRENTQQFFISRNVTGHVLRRPARTPALPRDEKLWLGLVACLVDHAVSIANPDHILSDQEVNFLAPAAVTPITEAGYIICDGQQGIDPDFSPACGSLEEPENGATLFLIVDDIHNPQTGSYFAEGQGFKTQSLPHSPAIPVGFRCAKGVVPITPWASMSSLPTTMRSLFSPEQPC